MSVRASQERDLVSVPAPGVAAGNDRAGEFVEDARFSGSGREQPKLIPHTAGRLLPFDDEEQLLAIRRPTEVSQLLVFRGENVPALTRVSGLLAHPELIEAIRQPEIVRAPGEIGEVLAIGRARDGPFGVGRADRPGNLVGTKEPELALVSGR